MIETLREADRKLFLYINSKNDGILDFVMYWATDKWIWIPFYLWLLYMLWKIYGRNIIWILLIVTLMIAASDQASVYIKNTVQRLRPCHVPELGSIIHLVNNACGGKYGFLSSHASNSMALSAFLFSIIPRGFRWMRYELAGYVILVGYSRIYLAAHYPGDVLAGWILGILIALAGAFVFNRILIKNAVRDKSI